MSNPLTYWAAERESKDVVAGLQARRRRYLDRLVSRGVAQRMMASWSQYYGWGTNGDKDTSATMPAGEQGKLIELSTNEYAQQVNRAVETLMGAPAKLKSITQNADFKSRAAAELADGIIDSYEAHTPLLERDREATRGMLLVGEYWEVCSWDFHKGEAKGAEADGSGVVREGDVRVTTHGPWDVAYDVDVQDMDSQVWFAFSYPANRYELAARRPDLATRLLSATDKEDSDALAGQFSFGVRPTTTQGPSDQVRVWEFRHLPTDALPRGRILTFVAHDCVLYDSMGSNEAGEAMDFGYPYNARRPGRAALHAWPLTQERQLGTLIPHTLFSDCLGAQEMLDTVATAIATAVNSGSLSNWHVQSGGEGNSNFNYQDLGDGLKVFESPVKPTVMEGVKLAPQTVEAGEWFKRAILQRAGSNDVANGETTKGMPAQLAALLQSQVAQFWSGIQFGLYRHQSNVRSSIIELLRQFSKESRLANIIGKAGAWQVKAYEASDLEPVQCVSFEALGNIMRTQAGRATIADKLLDLGQIDQDQYITLYTTGRVEPLWASKSANLARIQRERELITEGVGLPPPVLDEMGAPVVDEFGKPLMQAAGGDQVFIRPSILDTPWIDIKELSAIVSSPDARNDPKVMKAALEVIQEKLEVLQTTPPLLLTILGCPPEIIQQIAAMNAPPIDPNLPPTSAVGEDAAISKMSPTQDAAVKLPSPPKDPATGEQPPPPDMGVSA